MHLQCCPRRLTLSLLAVATLTGVGAAQPGNRAARADWLISQAESQTLEQGELSPEVTVPRSPRNTNEVELTAHDGPQVDVIDPKEDHVSSPIEIHIRFHATGSPVDMNSLEIHAQKWVLGAYHGSLDLSPRLRRFMTGNEIDAGQQNIPKGRYRLTFEIKDVDGDRTAGAILLDVS